MSQRWPGGGGSLAYETHVARRQRAGPWAAMRPVTWCGMGHHCDGGKEDLDMGLLPEEQRDLMVAPVHQGRRGKLMSQVTADGTRREEGRLESEPISRKDGSLYF